MNISQFITSLSFLAYHIIYFFIAKSVHLVNIEVDESWLAAAVFDDHL